MVAEDAKTVNAVKKVTDILGKLLFSAPALPVFQNHIQIN